MVKSDNGPPFNSHKFEEYAREEGFKHRKVTPGWPEANGDVERCMQRIKKTARIATLQGRPIRDEVRRGVRAYRATVHPTTGASPNKLMCGRELRGKLPEPRRQPHTDDTTVRKRDREQKEKMKRYADKRRHTAAMRIKVGDTVLCKQEKKQPNAPIRPGSDGCHWHQGRHDHRQEQPENSDQELRRLEVTKKRVQAVSYT